MKDGCPMCAEIGAHCGRHEDESTPFVDDTPECDRCARSQGLCRRHRRGILPQLAQPFWYRLVGTHHQKSEMEAMSPEARRIYNRKRTKEARRVARQARMQGARARSLTTLSLPPAA